jgi:ribosome-associated protein
MRASALPQVEDSTLSGLPLARTAWAALEAKKGENLVILDVRGISTVTDYFVIATGNNVPHIKALFEEVLHQLKKAGASCFRKSGAPESEWLVADFVDVVIHVFSPDTRGYYALEQLWSDAKPVE